MSLETAMKALETPSPAPQQQQAITPKEVAAATVEQETNAKNDAKIAAESTSEKPVVADAAPQKPVDTASSKFSALAKKEKAIVQKDNAVKAREAAAAEREAKIAEREARIQKSEELWDKDIFKALEERGYTYQKLTDLMLEGKTVAPETQDPVAMAKKTIEQFKQEQQKEKETKEAADKKAKEELAAKTRAEEEEAWKIYNAEISEHVKGNPDDYELIAMFNQEELVTQTVDAFYQKNKRVLSIKEACDMVESYLADEYKKAASAKKFKAAQDETKKDTKSAPAEGKPVIKTLSNDMQPTSASVLPAKSEQDRMRRAMAALENKS